MNALIRLIFFSAILFCPILCLAQKTYVLSVGINDYKDINDLRLCENDAQDFASFMQSTDAEVIIISGFDATHENIISGLRKILAKAKSEDCVIFFFSGHGYEGGFCCWDMTTNSPSIANQSLEGRMEPQRLNMANRYYGGLSYPELQVLFRNCRAGRKMVIADACFSGGLKGNHINASVQSAKKGELIFILSSRPDETSLELPDGRNGLFTTFLLKGLCGQSDKNADRTVTLGELFQFVYDNVSEYAARIPHSQHPVLWGRVSENTHILRY